MAGTAFNAANWTGYETITADDAAGDVTNFAYLLDLQTLGATWASNVQSDGGDIRVTDTSNTIVPFDLAEWDYNGGDPLGRIRILGSGTFTTGNTFRVWSGYTGGTAVMYDVNEATVGGENAYNSGWEGYWPLSDQYDRTSNSNDLTTGGSVSLGGAAGKFATATDFTAASSQYVYGGSTGLSASAGTVSIWVKPDLVAGTDYVWTHYNSGNRIYLWLFQSGANYFVHAGIGGSSDTLTGDQITVDGATWYHLALTWNGTNHSLYVNGSLSAGPTAYSGLSTIGASIYMAAIGVGPSEFCDGVLDDGHMHSDEWNGDTIAYEFSQTNDNAGFWTSGGWTAQGGSTANSAYYNQLQRVVA